MPQCLFTFYLDIIFQTHCFSLVMNFLTLVKVLRLNYWITLHVTCGKSSFLYHYFSPLLWLTDKFLSSCVAKYEANFMHLQSNFLKGDVSLKLVIMPLLYFKGFQISLFFQSMYVVFCFSLTYAGYKFVMTG